MNQYLLTGSHRAVTSSLDHPATLSASRRSCIWLLSFIVFEMLCQLALLVPSFGGVRTILRGLIYLGSLALLFLLSGRGPAHPARRWAIAIVGLLVLELFHPLGQSTVVCCTQVALYAAILAPLFWVARLQISQADLRRALVLFWAFHTASAAVGILQVYFPGQYMPQVATGDVRENTSTTVIRGLKVNSGLKINLSSGERIWRPMGLTDTPGGAALAGYYAFVFGLGFFLNERFLPIRLAGVAGMAIGLFDIYLSQVRSILLMAAVCVLAFTVVLIRRKEFHRFAALTVVVPVLVFGSFIWAFSQGGRMVTDRLSTLTEYTPGQVYYQNRGHFLEETLTVLLPQYPWGAGLGRWGMVNYYLGGRTGYEHELIWVEIQLTGWLLDGGVPLILFYGTALGLACWVAWRIAFSAVGGTLYLWACLILAYDIGCIAVTFNCPLFIGQSGMEFWLLNACLFGAAVYRPLAPPAGAKTSDPANTEPHLAARSA
jgi:hypothetical protein